MSSIFSERGVLSQALEHFEERESQAKMAELVAQAYDKGQIALIEAGTGIGKSWAYLYPAIEWAVRHQEKTVIATHTIALQEQLLHKDLPFLLKMLQADVGVCLVKGMGNYICLRRLNEQLEHLPTEEMQQISQAMRKAPASSFSTLPFPVSSATKEKVAAEAESCNHVHCPHYKECTFFKERKRAQEAQILVVNQHLLLADMQKRIRHPGPESILPPFKRLVIDEGHHFEQIALESCAKRWDRTGCLRLLRRLLSEIHPAASCLGRLKAAQLPLAPLLQEKIDSELPSLKESCQERLDQLSRHLIEGFSSLSAERKIRLTAAIYASEVWQQQIQPALLELSGALKALAVSLLGLLREMERFKEEPFYSAWCIETESLAERSEEMSALLTDLTRHEVGERRVCWAELSPSNQILVDASLDISPLLHQHLFSQKSTTVLCSATLATAHSFHCVKKGLGLEAEAERITEGIFPSPFDYQNRVLFAVPIDMPLPSSPAFLSASIEVMKDLIALSRGGVFLLFTSYEMLQQCYHALASTALHKSYPFLKQGDLPRHQLLEQFKGQQGGVLFATDSFWEGVDVPGSALRCVVIAKLPFAVPSDPLFSAYTELLENPFLDYSVPQAVIKFKQGFGRLMRRKSDRGCVVCLDHRIVTKGYGKQFLDSLPSCQTCFDTKKEVFAQMEIFYDMERSGLEPLTSTMPSLRSTN